MISYNVPACIISICCCVVVSCPHTATLSCPLDTGNQVLYGMAYLQDKLYVLSDSILIHRAQKPFDRVGEIKTTEIKSPADIVSCPKTPCLYVYDKGAACIWKVTIPELQVRCWLDKIQDPCVMTASSSGEVLMVRNNAGAEQPVIIVEFYNQHGILTRQLHLPKAIQSLQRVYETQAESYIALGDGKLYKFRTNGSIIAEFEMASHPECSRPTWCMELSPYRVILGSGYYYGSPNASLLGLDLEWDGVLLTGVSGERLCYIKKSKQLAILQAQVINVYDVISQ